MTPASTGRLDQYLSFERHFERMSDDLGHNTDGTIRGGDIRVFAVGVTESGVETISHRAPPSRPHGRALPLHRVTDRARVATWISLVPVAPILMDAVFANADEEYLDAKALEQLGTTEQGKELKTLISAERPQGPLVSRSTVCDMKCSRTPRSTFT